MEEAWFDGACVDTVEAARKGVKQGTKGQADVMASKRKQDRELRMEKRFAAARTPRST